MARQRITPQNGIKLFESYTDFTGGLNTETSNERLKENEYTVLDNVDLSGRGSAKRRTGRSLLQTISGNPQGMSYFYRAGQTAPDIIFMAGGKLWVYKNDGSTPFELPLQDTVNGTTLVFQTTKSVEAVQYNKSLYIATGTKLSELSFSADAARGNSTVYKIGDRMQYNSKVYECTTAGTTASSAPTFTTTTTTDGTVKWKYIADLTSGWYAKIVEAHKPTQMEFIYIGTNALASDPTSWVDMADELGLALTAKGAVPNMSNGAVGKPVIFTAYAVYTSGIPLNTVQYKWEYKKSSDVSTSWKLGATYAGANVNKSFAITFDTATEYDIRVTVSNNGTTDVSVYILTNFTVYETATILQPFSGIQKCTRVMLHWDRLVMFGDDMNPYQIYISDLNNPAYFPTTNTISFDIGKQEPLTAIVRFRDYLVLFTKTTVHSLTGKSPDDYARALIHDGIGCIAGRTAYVTGNDIVFLSAEGIYSLRPNQYVLETLNVVRADASIKSQVYLDEDACGMVYDSQYWICFPQRNIMYRLYYEQNIWVKDTSSEIKFVQMGHYGNQVTEFCSNGKVYRQDKTLYQDGSVVYDTVVQSKYLDLSMTFNYKKLKKLYVLARHFSQDVLLKVKVEADAAIALNPDTSHAEVDAYGNTVWVPQLTPNFKFFSGTTVGSWLLNQDPLGAIELSVDKANVSGKCRRVRVTFTHSEAVPCEVYGFGLEFKEKKT